MKMYARDIVNMRPRGCVGKRSMYLSESTSFSLSLALILCLLIRDSLVTALREVFVKRSRDALGEPRRHEKTVSVFSAKRTKAAPISSVCLSVLISCAALCTYPGEMLKVPHIS